MNIFFTSDTHYNHKNIVRGCTTWEDSNGGIHGKQRTRDFDTLEAHNTALVENINKVVGENDILYHLGDWSFGGIESIWEFRRQIKCRNIHFRYGNHDHHIENNKILPNCHFDKQGEWEHIKDGPNPHTKMWGVNARSLFASAEHYSFSKIGGQSMALSHFAMRVWDKGHHGAWMLYGHSHGTLGPYGTSIPPIEEGKVHTWGAFKTMDVGIDTHPEFRPYHFDEIAKIMKDRVNLLVDHHNHTTS